MVIKNNLKGVAFFSLIVMYFAYEVLYFSLGEGLILGLSLCFSYYFLLSWYRKARMLTAFFDLPSRRYYLYLLPLIPVILYLITLKTLASWDVVDAVAYIWLYLFLGIAWLAWCLDGMLLFWSFSYEDDVLMSRNKAALTVLTGGILGSSLIYAGANIGDGPGWWTVVFAGGLGTLTWLLLTALLSKLTGLLDDVIGEQDGCSALRLSAYLIASGLILARASAGDWTSFGATVVEFRAGWPVVPLFLAAFLLEHLVFQTQENDDLDEKNRQLQAVCIAVLYLLYGGVAVFMLAPLV